MSRARLEEVSDSDPEIDVPTDYLSHSDDQIIRPTGHRSSLSSMPHGTSPTIPTKSQEEQRQTIKHYCTLYPCYFSSARTRAQGRRVSKDLAIPNPLAYNLLAALREVIQPEFNDVTLEPDKTHPKDWSNPGRVRIQLFDRVTHTCLHPSIKNKRHLFVKVANYLQAHPTEKQDSLKVPILGLPVPEKFLETEIARPRGWKTMNQILPLHSPAVSDGSYYMRDDYFKEALEEMRQFQADRSGGSTVAGTPPGIAMKSTDGSGRESIVSRKKRGKTK